MRSALVATALPLLIGAGSAATVAADTPAGQANGEGVAAEAPPEVGVTTIAVAPSGHVRKEMGEPAGLTLAGSDRAYFQITVERITVTTTCPGRGVNVAPENGYFVVAEITATVDDGVDAVVAGGDELFMPLTADAFALAGVGGPVRTPTLTDASWGCFEDEALAAPFVGPGETVSGRVVLDAPIAAGTLVYAPGGAGWEWEFGQ